MEGPVTVPEFPVHEFAIQAPAARLPEALASEAMPVERSCRAPLHIASHQ